MRVSCCLLLAAAADDQEEPPTGDKEADIKDAMMEYAKSNTGEQTDSQLFCVL
jgi:hypothetical protein